MDYQAREDSNELLYVKCLREDGTFDVEPYRECTWAVAELRPEEG